jgi:hypothetical protein
MNYTLYLAVLIGAIIYAIFDFVGKKGNEVFTKKYLLAIVANVIAGIALIWAFKLKEGIMTIAWFDAARIIAMLFGITGQKLFKTLIDLADKEVKTKLGVNKK